MADTVASAASKTSRSYNVTLSYFDPRARLVVGILLIIQSVLIPIQPALIALVLLTGLFVYAGHPPLKRLAISTVAIAWMLAITLLLHAFTTPGHVLWEVPVVGWLMTSEGLINGSLLAGRLMALVLLGVTLSLSVSALEAIRALDVLLSPLARLKIPVGSFSLLLGMTLRFVPSIYEEALLLKKALRARGWNPGKSLLSRVRAWIPLFIPLLANALRRADDIAETLVLRGYDPQAIRTTFGLSTWKRSDSLVVIFTMVPTVMWILSTVV